MHLHACTVTKKSLNCYIEPCIVIGYIIWKPSDGDRHPDKIYITAFQKQPGTGSNAN